MDFFEGIVGRISRRKREIPQTPPPLEKKATTRVWPYEHFREYLLALGRGKDFLLPLDKYPDIIELSGDWHRTLGENRKLTQERNREHYTTIGFKDIYRSLHLPTQPLSGSEGSVQPRVIKDSFANATRAGIDTILGDVHSHPHTEHLCFSLGDIYGIVQPGATEYVRGVVSKDENLFVFKTRETDATKNPAFFDRNNFSRFWYGINGWEYTGTNPQRGELAHPVKKDAPGIWGLNQEIAKRYNLVLYSGDLGKELIKVYPIKVKKPL